MAAILRLVSWRCQRHNDIDVVFTARRATLLTIFARVMPNDDGNPPVAESDEPGVNRLPVLFLGFIEAWKQARDVIQDEDLDMVVLQHSIDGEAVLVAGKRQISARAGIDKFTGEPVQPGRGMIPGEFTQALLQRVQGHLAVHKEHRDLALHRPFEEGSRHAQTEGEFQKPVRLPIPRGP